MTSVSATLLRAGNTSGAVIDHAAISLSISIAVNSGSADAASGWVAAFRKGLGETGYVEGRNVIVEYHWLEGQFDRLPALMADLVRCRVAVIATPADIAASIAAKALCTRATSGSKAGRRWT